ncbi:hypothetical protein SprV_0100224400 [Sparganum proliferum]
MAALLLTTQLKSSAGVSTSNTSTSIPNPNRPCSLQRSFFPPQPMQCHATHFLKEVADVIQRLSNNKAPGEDVIPAEIYKSCVDTLAPWPHEVIKQAWRDDVAPDDEGLNILVPILTNGDKTRCENYGDISLVDVAAEIFAIVLRRFQTVHYARTRPNQAKFRSGFGCADHVFTEAHSRILP